MERPAKRAKLLFEANDSGSDADEDVQLPSNEAAGFKINEEFAKRFEHNKKREEKQQLEEKYKGVPDRRQQSRGANGVLGDDAGVGEDEESTDESEDDDADLVTETLDAEILDTLQAIKRKDPRVYDANIKFYRDFEADEAQPDEAAQQKKEKPMYLQDYHRQNLLAGHTNGDEDDGEAPVRTYQDEQDRLKRELVGSMHANVESNGDVEHESDEEDFLVAKSKPKHDTLPTISRPNKSHITETDVAAADKDPETYLSNFMAARAWLPTDGSRFQAFDSDDSEDEKRADGFEEAYNLRFEDPQMANEKLLSFSRDVGKYGVRRDEASGRKRIRERERERKEAEKREREEERARLRKLKIEEAEEKVEKIREAAGLRGKDVDLSQWKGVIEGEFDDEQWDREMKRRFGEQYYDEQEGGHGSEEGADAGAGKRKVKKPKWDDDIEIDDLVPDFEAEEDRPDITLSSDDEAEPEADAAASEEDVEAEASSTKKKSSKKDRLEAKREAKRAARKQRMAIEEMVDATLPITTTRAAPGFRYRETSPTNFGLSARDILFAEDTQLNEYAGLKKMAAWRDDGKKAKDRKKFSKKARLRQWRKETFGQVEEVGGGFERVLGGQGKEGGGDGGGEGGESGGKKRKKRKGRAVAVAEQ